MSDNATFARPYAKAIFEHALLKGQLADWTLVLHDLSEAVLVPCVYEFICNPSVKMGLQSELLLSMFDKLSKTDEYAPIRNTIELLAHNKRLLLLPEIAVQFNDFRASHEKTLTVSVKSFDSLTTEQEEKLTKALSERLQRAVKLDVIIDKSLIGGALIIAGDLVIDGSVRGKLNKLHTELAA